MAPSSFHWTFKLAPDVALESAGSKVRLRTAVSVRALEVTPGQMSVIDLLAHSGGDEAHLVTACRAHDSSGEADASCFSLLFRLERLGLLCRGVVWEGRRLVWSAPLRAPSCPPPDRLPNEPVRLSRQALICPQEQGLLLTAPGAWADALITGRELMPLVFDLMISRRFDELAAGVGPLPKLVVAATLSLLEWCGLLSVAAVESELWSTHDLLFHTRTRDGFARRRLGKTDSPEPRGEPRDATICDDSKECIPLTPPDLRRIEAEDPPHAVVAKMRRSIREQGTLPITLNQLSELLFRTLKDGDGRRPYPSGGSCYPLTAYLAVERCLGLGPGLYAYEPLRHELHLRCGTGPDLLRLLAQAARAAGQEAPPQVLLVLSARFGDIQRFYGDLSYSLILKEVGAVFQAIGLAAAAMGLAACPLGCGDSGLFAKLVGRKPFLESSVGELMVGSCATR